MMFGVGNPTIRYSYPYYPQTTIAMLCPYQQLLQLWASQPYDHATNEINFRELPPVPAAFAEVSSRSPHVTWVFNVRTLRYDYVSENATERLGMRPEQLQKEGIALYKKSIHPEDDPVLWHLTYKAWRQLLAMPAPERAACGYNREYRFLKTGGTYQWLLEQNRVLQTDRRGNITHLLGTCTEIIPFSEDNLLRVSLLEEQSGTVMDMSAEVQETDKFRLSKREREVLKLVASGLTSIQIARKLYLSFHTVNKHRSNINRKIKSRPAAQLVQFPVRPHLIKVKW